jgi:SAM-dependent methyltransferase
MGKNPDATLQRMSISKFSWLVPPRVDQPEKLDQGEGSVADVTENLAEMWRTNRYLGGLSALTRHLYPRLVAHRGSATVLDLGTGGADIPAAVARWSQSRGFDVTVVGIDWAVRNLAVARKHLGPSWSGVKLIRADALKLPMALGGVDYVISSLFLHHFQPSELVDLLRSAFACARRGMVMTDLRRGRLPLAGFHLIQPIFARNALTRYDGALSICRAYTPSELFTLAKMAGLPQAHITCHWPWRMTLVVDRES